MQRVRIIMTLASIATGAQQTWAQQALDPNDSYTLPLPSMLIDLGEIEADVRSRFNSFSLTPEDISAMRASGIDPSWIAYRSDIPEFSPTLGRTSQGLDPLFVEAWADHHSDRRGLALSDTLRFKVGRTTDLSDGNISGSNGALGNNANNVASITQSEGEYDIYDLSLQWDALETGSVKLTLLSGLKAIEADIAKRVQDSSGNTSIDTANRVAAIPMVGSGVSWQITDDFSIRGSALTHPVETGDTLIDFNAATDLRISRNIAFVAGYRIIRSNFEVGGIDTDITQEGLFARLQISF